MINHARTVLLNERPEVAMGVSTIYVPTDFEPIQIPQDSQALYDFLFPITMTLTQKVSRVDAIVQLLHSGELSHYCTDLDPRITYFLAPPKFLELLTAAPAIGVSGLLQGLESPAITNAASAVLNAAPKTADTEDFKATWSSRQDLVLRFGALVLALIHRLDDLRI